MIIRFFICHIYITYLSLILFSFRCPRRIRRVSSNLLFSNRTKVKFRYDERYVDPRDIALRDRDEFYVEKILAHHGDVGRLKTLAFHVKWRGFDESFNSWEPWKNLREAEMLHRYLILHGLQKLIPAKFREKYPELAVGLRRRRQDVAADEEAQQVSAVGLESSLWSSETWAGNKAIEDPQEIPQDHVC